MPATRLERILEMLAQNPNDSFLLYGLANEYRNGGDFENAVATYRRLMEVNPDYVAAYLHCGQTLESAGNPQEAASAYEQGSVVARRIGDAHALSELQAARDLLP